MRPRPSFTLGIEEEFQVIDTGTRELKSHVQEMFAAGELLMKDKIKREMHQSVVEVGSGICANIGEARKEVTELPAQLIRLARDNGVHIGAAGTHPFSNWADVPITDD